MLALFLSVIPALCKHTLGATFTRLRAHLCSSALQRHTSTQVGTADAVMLMLRPTGVAAVDWACTCIPARRKLHDLPASSMQATCSDRSLSWQVYYGTVIEGDPGATGHVIQTAPANSSSSRQVITYRTEKVVGNGSFGVVYQATCIETGDQVCTPAGASANKLSLNLEAKQKAVPGLCLLACWQPSRSVSSQSG